MEQKLNLFKYQLCRDAFILMDFYPDWESIIIYEWVIVNEQ